MGERHITIPVADLRCLELYCNECGTGILLDLENETAGLPQKCPGCNIAFNSGGLPETLLKFRQFRKEMAGFKRIPPQFRIKEEGP